MGPYLWTFMRGINHLIHCFVLLKFHKNKEIVADIVAGLQIVSSPDGGVGLGESGCVGITAVMWKGSIGPQRFIHEDRKSVLFWGLMVF